LKVDGKRMGKSLGNAYTVTDVVNKGFDPLSLRYFYLSAHYKSPLNFTWEALEASSRALTKLRVVFSGLQTTKEEERTNLSEEKMAKISEYRAKFQNAISDDLNTPQALAVVWEVSKSNIPSPDKRDLLLLFDEVLGLKLNVSIAPKTLTPEVKLLLKKREELRLEKRYEEADKIRNQLEEMGYTVSDESFKG
jgi:cysteinyl-tRNA synthetase